VKTLLIALLAAVLFCVPAAAITVITPANGAQVTSPFELVANTSTCGLVPAVSMGYSIDSGTAIIEPTSFTALVSASPGAHLLHVKCWGQGTNGQLLLNITVDAPSVGSNITVSSPVNGTKVIAPFILAASTTTCDSTPAASMGYSIDGGTTVSERSQFSVALSPHLGTHVLTVKCFGQNTSSQVQITVDVVPPPTAATPQFSLPSGQYTSKQLVAISDATAGATLYYTTDGSGPSTSSHLYTGAIPVASSMVLQAIAIVPGYTNSGLARGDYSIVQTSQAPIPSSAIHVDEVQAMSGWRINHDPGTPGTAEGAMSGVSAPTLTGQTEAYDTSFTNGGGVLYSITYDNDSSAENFVYDVQVWIAAGSVLSNLEMDNNQVIANGDTVIYAFQCSGYSNTWEYTENAGTPASPIVQWVHSSAPCNPSSWATNAWHHVQISSSRDDSGNVTYHAVWLDGVESPINATVNSAFSLGWASGDLVANFQVDGIGASGSSTLYVDNLTMYRW
jgi:hypothetical protein